MEHTNTEILMPTKKNIAFSEERTNDTEEDGNFGSEGNLCRNIFRNRQINEIKCCNCNVYVILPNFICFQRKN